MEASQLTAAPSLAVNRWSARGDRVALARRVDRRITFAMLAAHTAGVADVLILVLWALPGAAGSDITATRATMVAFAIYVPLATLAGVLMGRRLGPDRRDWLLRGRRPTAQERDSVLRAPVLCTVTDALLWLGGALLAAATLLPVSGRLALHVSLTVVLGGVTTCVIAYMIVERLMRPVTALALEDIPPARPVGPGVKGRLLLTWAFASGAPLVGLLLLGLRGMDGSVPDGELARGVVVVAAMALMAGVVATLFAARSVADPIRAVRRALARVEGGDFGAMVRVDDGSEVGLLQTGFNRMAGGLRERERLRDLYGRQVGEDVARATLDAQPSLGGQRCEVAVLFVDVIGSTRLAADRPPEEVVSLLNRFYGIVVETVGAQGGWVNKFEGDAALCVFGAPEPLEDAAGCALAAARALRERLRRDLPEARAGIGVSAGAAVAGWLGVEQRFEYTVIGDAVNEAARLCELAKRRDALLLASEAIVARADGAEAARWRFVDATTLRGRSVKTRLASPAPA